MSFEILNGSSYPVIIVKDYTNLIIETINLDLCNLEGGQKESWRESFRQVTLDKDNEIITYGFKGSRGRFILDYSQLMEAGNLYNIDRIFYYNSLPETYKLFLRPRADVVIRQFQVIIADEDFNIGKIPDNRGHTDTIVNFITKKTVGKNFQNLDYLSFPSPYFQYI